MVEPPTGTLTFLFTDIEGSTGRWEAQSAEMEAALARHDAVLRAAVEGHGGFLFKHTGDGILAVFASANAAVAAAVEAQLALELPVRMGLATGEATYRDGDYFGPTLNRAARVEAAGHGGQILLANATAALVTGFDLVDLDEHRLRDLSHPERIFQVRAEGLRGQFPPLRTLDTIPGNLPLQTTSFVGREEEVWKLVATLREHRLVTLTGVGGVGKTRLALEVATALADGFEGGAWLVELAPVGEPGAVGHAIAATLSIAPQPNVTVEESVVRALTGRNVLVILDNCEHVIDAVAVLVEQILRRCSGVTMIATSREALRVDGEQAWPVPSLGFRDGVGSAAVTLFAERARAVDPAFDLAADAHAVVEICRRLDGIPLAIELAAARLRAMSPAQIRDRLDERFRLLTGGSRRALERHQTLRHAVQWSFDLLGAPEQVLFRRAAVFAGGFSLEAAERVCAGEGVEAFDVLDLLDSLVRKSLVTTERTGDQLRYGMLETVRQFGEEQLAAAGEVETRRTAHARHFAEAASRNWGTWCGPRQREANEWLERELDNLRVAFRWGMESGDLATAAGIAVDTALIGYWALSFEPVSWAVEAVTPSRAAGLSCLPDLLGAAALSYQTGRLDEAERFSREAIDGAGRPGCQTRWSLPGYCLAFALYFSGRFDAALVPLREGMSSPTDFPLLHCRALLPIFLSALGRPDEARPLAEEAVRLALEAGIPSAMASAYDALGYAQMHGGEGPQSIQSLERAARVAEDAGLKAFARLYRRDLAAARARAGDVGRSLPVFLEHLESARSSTDWAAGSVTLAFLLPVLGDVGRPKAVAVLSAGLGALSALTDIRQSIERARSALGDAEFERMVAEGASIPFIDLVRYAEGEVRAILAALGDGSPEVPRT